MLMTKEHIASLVLRDSEKLAYCNIIDTTEVQWLNCIIQHIWVQDLASVITLPSWTRLFTPHSSSLHSGVWMGTDNLWGKSEKCWRQFTMDCHPFPGKERSSKLLINFPTFGTGKSSSLLAHMDIKKYVCHLLTSIGQRKFWVLMRNWTSNLQIPCSHVLPLNHRDSMVSKGHYKFHIWHISCTLLGSALLIAPHFVNRGWNMVSFKLSKET